MLAGAGTVPAAARVQEPGVTAPSAAAMNLPAVATDAPETSAASGPAPESVVRVNPSPASTSAKTSAPDWKTDPPDSPTAVSGEEASPAGAAAGRGTVNALEPPEGPAVQESAAHTFRNIAVDDGGEGSAAGKQEEPGAGGQPVFQAAAVNSYDITLKPGSNLISLPLIPDDNADVGQDQRDIGSAEESPASVRLVAEVPAPVESAASLTLVDLNNNLLKLEANRSLRESDHAITDTDPSFSHSVTGGDTSNFKPDGTQGTPQLASKGSITCDPGSSPQATKTFKAAISVTNHTLSEDDELYVIVTFSREIYEWNRDRRSTKFSLKPGQTHEEIGEFRSLLPGEGYAIECELRRNLRLLDLVGPFSIGWPDESVATDRKTFSVGDFQSKKQKSVARITECSASPSNLQVGDTVTLQLIAERKDANSTLTAASFIQIFQDAKLVDSYPPPGKARREKEIAVKDLTTDGIDRTGLVDYTFTPSEPGLYTAYCFLHTGAVRGFTAKTRDENLTLNDYYKVLSLFLPGGGDAFSYWSEILSGYFSHLESVKSVHFCVGDPEDCEFYSTSDDESSGEPDLEVESLTVSKSAMEPGETFTLTASVLNSGSGASSETTLRYYRSTTSTFSTSVTEDPMIDVIGLDPSGTERVSHPLAAPSDPGLYYYITCVAPASGESNTDNNCSTGVLVTVEATQQGSPDLVVEASSVSKNEIQPGGRFTLFATVRNIGDARAGSAILRYYRSPNSSISAGSDTEVGSDTVNSLQPSRTDGESVGVSAPEAPGEYYYGACVVPVTGESDTGNNCSSGRRVTVAQATTNPDLVVDSPSVSQNEVDAGGRFTLRTTVRNRGDGPAPAATLRYYRSADSTITTGDAEVETDRVRYLDPSETDDESERLTAPDDAGTYYYGACVDSVSDESDTNNNCSSGVIVTVAISADGQDSPDLVVHSPSVYDKVFDPGERFQMSFWVRNEGDAGTTTNATLRYYRSADSTISTADTELTIRSGVTGVGPIDASGSTLVTVYLDTHSSGTYYYGACVDSVPGESSTTNNCSSGVQVTVTAAPQTTIDFAFSGAPAVSDDSLETGDSFTLSVTVRNGGSGSSAATTLRYYRSTDSAISTSDTEVGTDPVGALGPSGTEAESISLTAPDDAGRYYYGACVDSVTGESDTANNCSSGVAVTVTAAPQTRPDLVVSVSIGDTELEPGETFAVTSWVSNSGLATSPATTLRIYRSTDSSISAGDTVIGVGNVRSLAPSETQGYDLRKQIAPSVADTYYYGSCVDSVPGESSTTNNCSSGVSVTVSEASQVAPDLVVYSPSVYDKVFDPGERFSMAFRVRNEGDGASTATATLKYYRSSDSTISSSDTELTIQIGTIGVSPIAASGNTLVSIDLNAHSSGTYYYGACVGTVPNESDTSNNCAAVFKVTLTAPDLVVESESVSDSNVETGDTFTFRATVRNQGDGTAESTTLRYYRSTDSTISTSDTEVDTDSVSSLDASETGRESERLTAPSTTGTYYYGVCVDAVTRESDTTNNCSSGIQVTVTEAGVDAPNLTVDTPVISGFNGLPGDSVRFDIIVRNQGEERAGATALRLYRSTDSTFTSSDRQLITWEVAPLNAGSSRTYNILNENVHNWVATLYYGACVDSVTDESDTTNNCSSALAVTTQ